jgi:acyl carrier protein
VVVTRDDADGDRRLHAFVIPASGDPASRPTSKDLRAHLRQRLPAYMVPATLTVLDELPLTPNGKVDRKALAARQPTASAPGSDYVMPQTEAERAVAAIWQRVLDVERVGLTDNFFDLGGHSLLVVKVQALLQEHFARELPMVTLFQYPTVAALAQHLGPGQAAPSVLEASQTRAERQKAALQQQGRLRAAAQRTARRASVPSNGSD